MILPVYQIVLQYKRTVCWVVFIITLAVVLGVLL
jgi:hypothetical protein